MLFSRGEGYPNAEYSAGLEVDLTHCIDSTQIEYLNYEQDPRTVLQVEERTINRLENGDAPALNGHSGSPPDKPRKSPMFNALHWGHWQRNILWGLLISSLVLIGGNPLT